MDIRDRIRQVLASRPDFTPSSVSLAAGLSNSYLQKFLNPDASGGVKSMTVDKLEAIARALDVNPRWLMWGDAPMSVDPKVVYIWDKMSADRKKQAMKVLQALLDDDADDVDGTHGR